MPPSLAIDPASAAAGDDRVGPSNIRPRMPVFEMLSTAPARVVLVLLLLFCSGLGIVQSGVLRSVLFPSSQSRASDDRGATLPRPTRTRRPSHSRPPTPSPSSRPLTPCTCEEKDLKKQTTVHILDADNRDAMVMGIELLDPGQAALSGVFGFTNVLDILNHDPVYPTGRTIVLQRENIVEGTGSKLGSELNQDTAVALQPLTFETVPFQKCHLEGFKPPFFYYIDSTSDQDAGEWLGESALFLNDARWGFLLKRHPDIKLLLKAPAPHKSAILQLLDIPPDQVTYLNPGIPCEGGNRVYLPPFGRNDAPGWSQEWWKSTHMALTAEQWRKAAGLPPKCPKESPSKTSEGAVVYIAMSSSDKIRHEGGKTKDVQDMQATVEAFESLVKEFKGRTVTFPDSQDLDLVKGTETKDFFAAIGTARVVLTYSSSSTFMLASLARGATLVVGGAKSGEAAKSNKRPGHVTEKAYVAKFNAIIELGSDPKKATDEAKKAVKEALEEGEKKKPPKCI